MALKQKKDGTFVIETAKDLEAAALAVEERTAAIEDLEREMEEQYDYLTMKEEIASLNEAMKHFMTANDVKHVFRDDYKLTLIRRVGTSWDPDKLKALLPKNLWLRVTKPVIDPGKIDDLVRKGDLDEKKIAPALVSKPQAPYVQRFDYKKGQTREEAQAEELALRAQLEKSDEPPAKRGKKGGRK